MSESVKEYIKDPTEYIVTIRVGYRDAVGELVAGQKGVDILLNTNDSGRLVFPNDLFVQARTLLLDDSITAISTAPENLQ